MQLHKHLETFSFLSLIWTEVEQIVTHITNINNMISYTDDGNLSNDGISYTNNGNLYTNDGSSYTNNGNLYTNDGKQFTTVGMKQFV